MTQRQPYVTRPMTPHNLRTVADIKQLAALADTDARTAVRWLAGLRVYRFHGESLTAALREIESKQDAR